MIIKKISLHNFRQFIDSTVEFAHDPTNNVTLVLGENGAGKTTLAQAFLWCLYTDTDFADKEVLNRKVRDKLPPDGTAVVEVALEVEYNGKEYLLKRRQSFHKKKKIVNQESTNLSVTYIEDNQVRSLEGSEKDYLIKHMLPKELSRFFFFDGERIKSMSEDIEQGKSKDFKNAVAGLVGLTGMQNAMRHLQPKGSPTVISAYNAEINKRSGDKVQDYVSKIEVKEKEVKRLAFERDEKQKQIDFYEEQVRQLDAEILAATPSMEMKDKYEKLGKRIEAEKIARNSKIAKTLFGKLDKELFEFMSLAVVNKAKEEIALIDKKVGEKATIPSLEAPALLYLLKQGKCICGEPLVPGDDHFKQIMALMDFVPPKTLGTLLVEVKNENKHVEHLAKDFYVEFESILQDIEKDNEQIERDSIERASLYALLSDTTTGEKAKAQLANINPSLKNLKTAVIDLSAKIQNLTTEIERLNTEKNKLVTVSANNEIYYRALAYATRIYNDFYGRYSVLEETTRKELQKKINELFSKIYESGMKIRVDEQYNITVLVDDEELEEAELEKNTAQSFSVIFAFITTVIAMAKEKANSSDAQMEEWEKEIFNEAEGLPLVMDAPLSNFDKTRIEQMCNIIPNIANQVVIFIKDTDGDIAEQHLAGRIGKRYSIIKVNESKTNSVIKEEC